MTYRSSRARFLRSCTLFFVTPLLMYAASPWEMTKLSKPPKAIDVSTSEPAVRALFFESVPWKGKPTQVFAYYGAPEGKKLPAIVLIHGGGGTAFAEWVRQWNRRGYAAIAIDTCGAKPETAPPDKLWNPTKRRHDMGGPEGWGGFEQVEDPISDQWTYHAVSAAILAHSLIRSFPEVDSKRTGVTGISWGGYLTDIASSVDGRFRFAIPVYGCGFLGEDSGWLDTFHKMGSEKANRWLQLWDPSVYLPRSKTPMLWVTGTNDLSYPMGSLQKSYRLAKGPRMLSIRVRMPHGHREGAAPEEIAEFADSIVRGGAPLPRIVEARDGRVKFQSKRILTKVELNYTTDSGSWGHRQWRTIPAAFDMKLGTATAEIPPAATAWFFNLFDENGRLVSSEHEAR